MEKYRRAAVQLRAEGIAPTVENIAQRAKVRGKHFRALLSMWPDLRNYVGVVSTTRARRGRYETIIADLESRGMLVEARKVADELEISVSSLYKYAARNCEGKDSRLLSKAECVRERYRQAVARIKAEGRLVTRKAVAFELGKSVATVNQYLWSQPAFSEELGIVYTQKGHHRLYTKKRKTTKT